MRKGRAEQVQVMGHTVESTGATILLVFALLVA